jgi:hypothetical protein
VVHPSDLRRTPSDQADRGRTGAQATDGQLLTRPDIHGHDPQARKPVAGNIAPRSVTEHTRSRAIRSSFAPHARPAVIVVLDNAFYLSKEDIHVSCGGPTRCRYRAYFRAEAARLFGAAEDDITGHRPDRPSTRWAAVATSPRSARIRRIHAGTRQRTRASARSFSTPSDC